MFQPLHIGFLGDKVGNKIQVRWYSTGTNLYRARIFTRFPSRIHEVWDEKIIESALTYASESITAACNYAYANVTSGSKLGDHQSWTLQGHQWGNQAVYLVIDTNISGKTCRKLIFPRYLVIKIKATSGKAAASFKETSGGTGRTCPAAQPPSPNTLVH
ncbi:S1/P1 nuclease [Parasponia andersonii]|uniref:Aspergillus nuclease S1 n=1 Tax=Parasponia andersonii TaxID=3476 RepID=A0A2P5DCG4_PARAD|nr:S1/P1 nuclease [Parasponia andersonii]